MNLTESGYEIQGTPVLEIAQQYDTPVYVYDSEIIHKQYKKLSDAFSGIDMKVKFACKALSNVNILRLLKSFGSGLDTVSIQEVELGLYAGFDPADIIYTPNCVSYDEIKEAINKGVVINIDNLTFLEKFGHDYGNSIPCCIRLNPHILAGGNHHIQTGHIDSKFGISIYQLRHLLRIITTYNIKVTGLHVHSGSDILDADVFLQGAEIILDTAKNFADLEFIDFGSGFKVGYKDDDVTTDIAILGDKMSAVFNDFCNEYGKKLQLWFEPGKYLVSEAGYFLVTTNVVKQTVSTVFAGVNSGQNHLIRPMFYDAYHGIVNISNPNGAPRVYSVVGYICETDTFAWDRKIPEIREGDILCFLNAGAYGFTMSSNYNSRLRPAEVLIHEGKHHLIRRREVLNDLLSTQIEIQL